MAYFLLFFMMKWQNALVSIIMVAFLYGITKGISYLLCKKGRNSICFLVEQIIYIGGLLFTYRYCEFYPCFENCTLFVKVVFVILMLMAPASQFINYLFADLYPCEEESSLFDIGSIIGIFERFLAFIFAYFENFAAIAIIITVKTWARTNDLKEPEFRNKYLLGTLASLVLSLCTYMIFRTI